MNFQEIVAHAKESLRQSMKKTLKFIVPLTKPDSEVFDSLIHIEGRYNQIEAEFNKGLINSEEKDIKLNQCRESILNILNQITDGDIKIRRNNEGSNQTDSNNTMLEKLRESIAEIEKLKAENRLLKDQDSKYKLKIIIQCEPEINAKPNSYSCNCIILDDKTGQSIEKEIPLRKEPGGIIATIHDINPSDYIQVKIRYNEKEWESDYFSPQFLTQILRQV